MKSAEASLMSAVSPLQTVAASASSARRGPVFVCDTAVGRSSSSFPTPRRSWPVVLFLILLMLPPEATFFIGPLALTPLRLALTIAFLPMLVALFASRSVKFCAVDFFVIFHVTWAAVALFVVHGVLNSVEPAGIYAIEVLGAYLVTRIFVRDPASFRGVVMLLSGIIIGLAIITVPESITGQHVLREFFANVLGKPVHLRTDSRLGLFRAFGPFQHPILYGLFCASATGLAWYAWRPATGLTSGRLLRAGGIAISTLMSVSTGALMSLVVQAAIIAWDLATRRLRNRWWILLGLFLFMYFAIDVLSNRTPLAVFISYLTLNPATGYNRMTIWQHGSVDVVNHPVFGIGFNDWSRPAWMHSTSMDAFWLVLAVRYGLPAAIAMALAYLYQVYRLCKIPGACWLEFRLAWIVSMTGIALAAITVHLWNNALIFFCFLLGMGMWMVESPSLRALSDKRAPKRST